MSEQEKEQGKSIIVQKAKKISDLYIKENENDIIINANRNQQKNIDKTLDLIDSRHSNVLPITMRKLLLCKQYKCG